MNSADSGSNFRIPVSVNWITAAHVQLACTSSCAALLLVLCSVQMKDAPEGPLKVKHLT